MSFEERYVFFDLETTGPDVFVDEITQIAAVATGPAPAFKELESFDIKAHPSKAGVARIDAGRIGTKGKPGFDNPYCPELWISAVDEKTAINGLFDFMSDYMVERKSKRGGKYFSAQAVGHNAASFDDKLLRNRAAHYGIKKIPYDFRVLDTLQLAMWAHVLKNAPQHSYSLEALAEKYKIPVVKAHDALSDVDTTLFLARMFSGHNKATK
jgi:DNA polymerase III alpha subunit (gram-positive type)